MYTLKLRHEYTVIVSVILAIAICSVSIFFARKKRNNEKEKEAQCDCKENEVCIQGKCEVKTPENQETVSSSRSFTLTLVFGMIMVLACVAAVFAVHKQLMRSVIEIGCFAGIFVSLFLVALFVDLDLGTLQKVFVALAVILFITAVLSLFITHNTKKIDELRERTLGKYNAFLDEQRAKTFDMAEERAPIIGEKIRKKVFRSPFSRD